MTTVELMQDKTTEMKEKIKKGELVSGEEYCDNLLKLYLNGKKKDEENFKDIRADAPKKPVYWDNFRKHYSDCPHGDDCYDFTYWDDFLRKNVPCEHCLSLRKKEGITLKENDFEKLKLPKSAKDIKRFSISNVIPNNQKPLIQPDSIASVGEYCNQLLIKVNDNEIEEIKESALINFGSGSFEMQFLAPFIKALYGTGYSLGLITSDDIIENKLNFENNKGNIWKELKTVPLLPIILNAGTSYTCGMTIKGLLESRAYQDKPTILINKLSIRNTLYSTFINNDNYERYDLCREVTVKYKPKPKKDDKELIQHHNSTSNLDL